MSITIPQNIAQHMFIKKHAPINYDIKHIVDSTGPLKGQSMADKRKKLSEYIYRDTSHYLPKFRRPAEFRKHQARQILGKILATTPPKGSGKRRRKTKRKKRKTKRKKRKTKRKRRKTKRKRR